MPQAPLDLNIGSSVVKREAKPIDEVKSTFISQGWTQTASVLGGRLVYIEKNAINLTLLQGPLGTVVFPSGPLRGAVFGDEAVTFNTASSVGGGSRTKSSDELNRESSSGVPSFT